MGVSPFPSMNQKTVALGNYTALNLGKWHDQCTEPPTNGQVIFCLSLSLPKLLLTNHISSWWLNQHMWKICSSKWVHLPKVGVKNTKKSLKPPPSHLAFSSLGNFVSHTWGFPGNRNGGRFQAGAQWWASERRMAIFLLNDKPMDK